MKEHSPLIKTTTGRRLSRLRRAEREALERVLPELEISGNPEKLKRALKTYQRVVLEIGFGRGDFLYSRAKQDSDTLYIGVEVFLSGVAKLLRRMVNYDNQNRPEPENILISTEDIRKVLAELLPEDSLDRVYVLFPDPWPKKRHHKRRLLKRDFIGLLESRLKKGADIVVATDSEDYAEEIYQNFKSSGFNCVDKDLIEVLSTKYAQKAQDKGHRIFSFRFSK
ncbi:MAG: tRNA (guanosine(46)-N7)-methyltransferase TrmB [Nitrospirae bacterium]|nr:MAG: tRNA (guanosine(46)-N7)-methyltransferase TrmB [Nitrospirota bacterium]